MSKLTRIIQIVWLFIAAVCAYESYSRFNEGLNKEGWIITAVGLVAIYRYVVLRRAQLRRENKIH